MKLCASTTLKNDEIEEQKTAFIHASCRRATQPCSFHPEPQTNQWLFSDQFAPTLLPDCLLVKPYDLTQELQIKRHKDPKLPFKDDLENIQAF